MSFPDFSFWWHLVSTVGAEVCGVAALGFVAHRLFRRAIWQRAVWEITVVCLLLVVASEWTGAGRGAAGHLLGKQRAAAVSVAAATLRTAVVNWPNAARLSLSVRAPRPAVWWPGWVWLAGAVIVAGRMAMAQLLLAALRSRRERITRGPLAERVASIAKCVGLRRGVNLLWMPESISPMAFGLIWPSIGLPPKFEEKYTVPEQEAVLAHELAHLAARDPRWFFLADVATALLWWHPLVWWVRRSLHVSAELAADDATALVPDGPVALAHCLVNLGKELAAAGQWGWIGVKGGLRSKLGMRVERLIGMSSDGKLPVTGSISALARMAAMLLVLPSILLLFGTLQSARGQKEESWQGEMRSSWNSSPGGLLLLAALNDKDGNAANPATQVQQSNTSLAYTSKGRQAILSQLERIRIKEIRYNAVPLTEVLKQLRSKSTDSDPDGAGINFMVNPYKENTGFEGIAPTNSTGNAAGGPVGARQTVDMSTVTVTINPGRSDLRLVDALDAVTMGADQPLRYTVGDDAVVFSLKPDALVPVYSKVFQVNPRAFLQGLKEAYGSKVKEIFVFDSTAVHKMIRACFEAAGINLTDPGKTIFYNDRTGLLYIRATEEDLKIVGQELQKLDSSPPQLVIEARFVELTQKECGKLGFSFNADNTMTFNGAPGFQFHPLEIAGAELTGALGHIEQVPSAAAVNGVMSDPQFRVALNVIEQRTEEDFLSTPRVTTLSGRQASINSGDGDRGVRLQVIATVKPDGFEIQTEAVATVMTETETCAVGISHAVWDTQTLVFGRMMTSQKPGPKKVLLVFVTPRIIDAAGNHVHAVEDLPFANSSVPAQHAP